MKSPPRGRSEGITDRGFLRTMFFTGFLTAGVAFAVYMLALRAGATEAARSSAFTVLVFAELLRSFGARSETKPVWRIPLSTKLNLVIVVAVSFGVQVWSQHNATLGNESPDNFVEQFPHRNAMRKVYISRSVNRDLRRGDAIVFYRTGGYYQSVVSTVGIVGSVHLAIRDEHHFISLCRTRAPRIQQQAAG